MVIRKREIVCLVLAMLVLALLVAAPFLVIVGAKDREIARLKRDLQESQMLIVIQHNENEILQDRLTAGTGR